MIGFKRHRQSLAVNVRLGQDCSGFEDTIRTSTALLQVFLSKTYSCTLLLHSRPQLTPQKSPSRRGSLIPPTTGSVSASQSRPSAAKRKKGTGCTTNHKPQPQVQRRPAFPLKPNAQAPKNAAPSTCFLWRISPRSDRIFKNCI